MANSVTSSQSSTGSSINAPPRVIELLDQFHKLSLDQETRMKSPGGGYEVLHEFSKERTADAKAKVDALMLDKFIALPQDKATFVYNLLRATGALNAVEAGTSFGVSTIYLALAIGQNAIVKGKSPSEAKVIATENEPTKANQARENWKLAGDSIEPWIELREGDLLQTLSKDLPEIDVVLFDIWTPVVLPTLKLLEPKFRPGTVLILDNVIASKTGYTDFYKYIEARPYTSMTLPYSDGLGLIVYSPTEPAT